MSGRSGKLIVITGPDGCGKKTQTELLLKKLLNEGYSVCRKEFPQYKDNFFGKMAGRYLAGEFGESVKINPYLASIPYAGDRFESMPEIKYLLDKGVIVICDRYVGDNFLHQGGKIKDIRRREEFFKWLETLEYSVFGAIPADVTFYLDVSLEVSLALLENKDNKAKKTYTDGKKDGHENREHLAGVRKISDELIERYAWVKIDCMRGGKIKSQEEIHGIIWENLISAWILNS